MSRSVLDAIKSGNWEFELEACDESDYDPTGAMPGSDEKVAILSQRLQHGLPLWHPEDRRTFDDSEA